MELLLGSGDLALRDLHAVYEALFLRAVVGLERFSEKLFLQILHGQTKYSPGKVVCRINGLQKRVAHDVLFQGKKYLNWLPFDQEWDKRLELYLAWRGDKAKDNGRPFIEARKHHKALVEDIMTIRNAISHSSAYAKEKFESKVIRGLSLLPGERTPAGFLRSVVTSTPPQRRFEAYMAELGSVAIAILGKPLN